MIDWWWLTAAIPPGFIIGYATRAIQNPSRRPNERELLEKMTNLVNLEELEERQRLMRLYVRRGGRKTTRFDGGPHAKVMRLKIRPGIRRRQRDGN